MITVHPEGTVTTCTKGVMSAVKKIEQLCLKLKVMTLAALNEGIKYVSALSSHCTDNVVLSKQTVAVWEMWPEGKTNTQLQAF